MDKRTFGQLNKLLFAEFRCRYNGDLIFDTENSAVNELFGLDVKYPISGKSLCDITSALDKEDLLSEIRNQSETDGEVEFVISTRDGRWILCKGVLERCDGDLYICGLFVVISKLKSVFNMQESKLDKYEGMIAELNEMLSKDPLTMILNAKSTRNLCEEYIAGNNGSFALMVIDIDCFKTINDVYGHITGDKVLIKIAEIIKNLFRTNDIVGRIGGDEFLVLMKGVEDKAIVENRSSQIISAFGNTCFSEIECGKLSCAVGVSFVKNNKMSYDDIFRVADSSMYSAKNKGGACYEICELQ